MSQAPHAPYPVHPPRPAPALGGWLLGLRLLVLASLAWPAFLALALLFVLGTEDGLPGPPAWSIVALLVSGGALWALSAALTHRPRPIPAGTPAHAAAARARGALATGTIVRLLLVGLLPLVAAVLAFVVPHGAITAYLLGAALSVVLVLGQAWPGRRVLVRTAAALERDGARSGLLDRPAR